MAPIGTVFKNGLIFLILTAGITYGAAQLIAFSIVNIFYSGGNTINTKSATYESGVKYLWLGLLVLIGGTGLVYMKSLSDTVEEGMIEF